MAEIKLDKELDNVFKRLDSMTDLDTKLEELKNGDYSKLSQEDKIKKLTTDIHYFPFRELQTRPYKVDLFPIYRLRKNINLQEENLELTSTFSYPNPAFCRSNGRANLANKPIFYSSDCPTSAYLEMNCSEEDAIYLSEWMIRCPRKCRYTYFLPSNLSASNNWSHVALRQNALIHKAIGNNYGNSVLQKVLKITDFYANLFTSEPYPYNFSSAIADYYLYILGYDFIIYAGNKINGEQCNIAFHPNFIDDYARLDKVSQLKVREVGTSNSKIMLITIGEYLNNKIMWRPPIKEDLPFYSTPDMEATMPNNA